MNVVGQKQPQLVKISPHMVQKLFCEKYLSIKNMLGGKEQTVDTHQKLSGHRQGGLMCGNLGMRFLDSEGSHRQQGPNIRFFVAKSHLSQFTRFLGILFPFFDSNSNRFATAAESLENICYQQKIFSIDTTGWLGYRQNQHRKLSHPGHRGEN